MKMKLLSAALLCSAASTFALADTVKIGYVSPQTGPLAAFAEPDDFIISQVKESLKNGLVMDGKTYDVEIIVKDSQSNPNRAAEVASELILSDEVDILVSAHTPETANPVSDQCEVNEIPCISTVVPWQAWFFGRGGNPAEGFEWTSHFFWGLEDVVGVFTDMWSQIDNNQQVGALFPNDGDGNAWGHPELGFPKPLAAKGYGLTDPGRYQNLSDDFTAQIGAYKKANADIITGVVIPPDFTTFWNQAQQQGLQPKAVSVAKALLFPTSVEALGDKGHNISTEVWWSPSHPFTSSLTGAKASELAADYTATTGKQWTQPIGFTHALFEVAVDALQRAEERSPEAIQEAVKATDINTVVGLVNFQNGPVPNVAKTPLVGGQWRLANGGDYKYEMVITSNSLAPSIPKGGEMEAIQY